MQEHGLLLSLLADVLCVDPGGGAVERTLW